ncbi:MAG: hypothetical protein A4E37_02243 [Methanoregulaceae archaeon PtaB.Bin056]|jgi:hypothetical protein|nr:MAG: hypothetical protein A4E37_02243 [Methanoregulaceae archaeon PtaB.Bin056]
MNDRVWREELAFRLGNLGIPVLPGTIFSSVAGELQEMAESYLRDGDHFEARGDCVNALASWSYALGWLDAGAGLGLIDAPGRDHQWIFCEVVLPANTAFRLLEKVRRYHMLLSTAIKAAVPAPEPGTVTSDAANRFILVAGVFREYGNFFHLSGKVPNALGSFSYGHAWLDAGVRAGLLRVDGPRDVFAV